MRIKRDPREATKAEVKKVLQDHEWLFLVETGTLGMTYIDYDLLADLVTDLVYEAKLYSPDDKNVYSPRVRVLRTVN